MLRKLIKDIEDRVALDRVSGLAAGWVQRATRHDAVENALSGTWLGHKLHPVLTDLPIGAWTMVLLPPHVSTPPTRRWSGTSTPRHRAAVRQVQPRLTPPVAR